MTKEEYISRHQAIIKIDITTYKGISSNAKHYYGTLDTEPEIFQHSMSKLVRPITQSEIDTYPDRFYYYHEGDETECFNSWRDVVKAGKDKVLKLGLDLKEVVVTGVPNNSEMSLEKALSDNVDTTLRCVRCGKPIHGGCYNLSDGVWCIKCREEIFK